VSDAMERVKGTLGLKLRHTALGELTDSQPLLRLQSPDVRKTLNDLRDKLAFLQREGNLIEELPLRERFQNNPIIGVGALQTYERTYRGDEWVTRLRPLTLTVPVSEACKNDELVKSLYYWERWQSELLNISRLAQGYLIETLEVLDAN